MIRVRAGSWVLEKPHRYDEDLRFSKLTEPICNRWAIFGFEIHRITSTRCRQFITQPLDYFGSVSALLAKKCAVKGAGLQRVQLPPGNWFAPPGSNRSGSGGNEAVGAFDVKGRMATRRACRP